MRRHPSRTTGAQSVLVGAAVVLGATLAVFASGTVAVAAEPSPSPGAESAGDGDPNLGPATAGKAICTLSSTTLDEITGMVATDQGILVIEGGDTQDVTSVVIHTVNAKTCKSTPKDYGFNPVDPQDLALDSSGAVWVADFGDGVGSGERTTIALEKVELGGSTDAVPHRMTFPSSGPIYPEALLLDKDDNPILIASESGKAVLYKPSKALVPTATTGLPKLAKAGEFELQQTGTETPLEAVGRATVTGAAKSPDGTKVVIRTASDAYEFTVGDDGDVIKAITTGTPVITPLPNEPNGKAITYSPDGKSFWTLSSAAKPKLLSYTPHVPAPPATDDGDGSNLPDAPSEQGWLAKLSFSELTRIIAAVGVVGLVLAIAGIVGIRRARKRRREEEEDYDYDDYDDEPPTRGRRGGRSHQDDRGYHQYGDGYDQHYGGYADQGYPQQGYADAGYGQASGAGYGAVPGSGGGYGAVPGSGGGYGAVPGSGGGYGAVPGSGGGYGAYGADQQHYGASAQHYGAQQYGQPQYGAEYDQYGGQQYGEQPYADPYAAPPQYGADQQQYGQPQYGGQQYGQPQYGGGYGYEDDFDPMQDPRRR